MCLLTLLCLLGQVNKTTGAMREKNENPLAVACWVILNSPDLFEFYNQKFRKKYYFQCWII